MADAPQKPEKKRRGGYADPPHPNWKKGAPGGPGRPPVKMLREFLISAIRGRTRFEDVVEAFYLTAIDRSHRLHTSAGKVLIEQIIGKPKERVEVSGPDGAPIPVEQKGADLTLLSDDQLRQLRALMQAAKRRDG